MDRKIARTDRKIVARTGKWPHETNFARTEREIARTDQQIVRPERIFVARTGFTQSGADFRGDSVFHSRNGRIGSTAPGDVALVLPDAGHAAGARGKAVGGYRSPRRWRAIRVPRVFRG